MIGHDIIVVGASAGGMEALRVLVGGLPADLPAALFVVWHMPAHSFGILPDVLNAAGPLPAVQADDGALIAPGHIYVAPPDRHLVLEAGRMRLTHGPKENHFRPAIDPLFRSAAAAYGSRVIGVVLTGMLDDGTAGLWVIKDRGGLAVVQDPDDALFPAMPRSAMEHVAVDYRHPIAALGPLLAQIVRLPAVEGGVQPLSEALELEQRIALEDDAPELGITKLGTPSLYTCPECQGVLLQLRTGDQLRFRCHTGHAFTADSLVAHAAEQIEARLWNVVRTLDENLLLLSQVAQQLTDAGKPEAATRMLVQLEVAQQQRQVIRAVALQREKSPMVRSL